VWTLLDYGSATRLASLPRELLNRLPSVMNATARLVFGVRKYHHVIPLLRDLRWLRAVMSAMSVFLCYSQRMRLGLYFGCNLVGLFCMYVSVLEYVSCILFV